MRPSKLQARAAHAATLRALLTHCHHTRVSAAIPSRAAFLLRTQVGIVGYVPDASAPYAFGTEATVQGACCGPFATP